MNAKVFLLTILVFITIALFAMILFGQNFWSNFTQQNQPQVLPNQTVSDYKNITYTIENQPVTLKNGYSEVAIAPGSASKTITKYFGNEAVGYLNEDTVPDVAFLLTQETGGSGVFYYLAAALKTDAGYTAANTIFLGDRIAPETLQITNGTLTVNYAIRKPSEPMSAVPSVSISKYFKFENGQLLEQMDSAEFGKPINLVVNQQVKFNDNAIVMLKEITDSQCKPGNVCIWAGEILILLNITIADPENVMQEIRLGTVNNKKISNNGYVFELKNATQTTATIIVTKDK